MKSVSWKCQICGARNSIEIATNKRGTICGNKNCNAVYAITGLHINGRPFLRYNAGTSKLERQEEKMQHKIVSYKKRYGLKNGRR